MISIYYLVQKLLSLSIGDLTSNYVITNYELQRFDRKTKRGGGHLLYIRNDCIFSQIKLNVDFPAHTECFCFKIKVPHVKPFLFISVYCPPKVNKNSFLDSLEFALEHFNNYNLEILLGDLNINLLVNDGNIKRCSNFSRHFRLTQKIREPTRISATSQTLLDHLYTSNETDICLAGCLPVTASDHFLIYGVKKFKGNMKYPPKSISYRNISKVIWDAVKSDFKLLDWKSLFQECTDPIDRFTTLLKSLVDKHSPLVSRIVKGKPTPWLNSHLVSLIKKDSLKKTNNVESFVMLLILNARKLK